MELEWCERHKRYEPKIKLWEVGRAERDTLRQRIIQQWRENNKKRSRRPDAEFEAFLRQEAEEIDAILESLEDSVR